ncbi:ribulokinase [Bacillus sp. NEB1478]|uniref:ribulokinase n=1 Tax=Bacillus sp. NEB1478 TaxID=3073816 RepID=UPI00287347D3|nr:ribulokinase [Bacillus sp. NEB1478]WNB91093.1 ribulokinase [Bacillus sp. NEB1478]
MGVKYSIGIDFGTESGRAVLVDMANGREITSSVTPYKHKVIDETLPDGTKLGSDWALQHPQDYFDVLYRSVPDVLEKAGISSNDVIGLGIDFTSCTMLPLDENLKPLCLDERWSSSPHSWVKLWKHHAAHVEADEVTKTAEEMNEPFLQKYGGKISSEWMFPKILQILKEAPELYEAADLFLEAGDWVTSQLTDQLVRSSCNSGYKGIWNRESGYPSKKYLKKLHPRLEDIPETKMRGDVLSIGSRAGVLNEEMAVSMGLAPGTPVAVGIIDAHSAVPAVGAVKPGQLVMAMGTSTCHIYLSDREEYIKGVSGVVKDGIIPDLYGYEAGQAAVGDIFGWYIDQAVPAYIEQQAKEKNLSVHQYLEEKASAYQPGQIGLLALDWWNGNRSILGDPNLSGLIVGLTLNTKPEEIYRALLEATAFGTRKIIETFEESGLEINEIFTCGGLPQVNQLLMQIYADVTNREMKIADSRHTPALGAAMFGAVAAGKGSGGYETIFEAAEYMARVKTERIKPIPKNVEIYDRLYEHYLKLHDTFGTENNMLHDLKKMSRS